MSLTNYTEEVCDALCGKGRHDIKAHLRAVLQFVELVREDLNPEDPQHVDWEKYLQISCTSASLLGDLIDRLTTLIRIEQSDAPEAVTFAVLPVIQSQAETSLVSVRAVTGLEHMACLGDPAMFELAMKECFDNIAKYGGKVASINLSEAADRMIIDIMDAGPGLNKEQRDLAFELFRRFVPVHNPPGAGLGLPIASSALRKIGGSIQLVEPPEAKEGLCLRIHMTSHP